ncbi:hypothetical protein JOQ06_019991 [Pogonophryne albipinna]|uniref:Tc1-like transposase DDE domain-containing protein n=1 Tax=Pogonophryne albipinna TaxID=1090488 RepID=A0AAD6BRD1_9TELE|nr:hypothetical protein JOQ06_019991 [Pogonophryne albipinna]
MDKRKDVSDFDKGQIVKARRLGQSISKTAALVGCSSGLFQQVEEHQNELKVLTLPPNSPDLNPVEHLWDVLDKQVRSMEAPPRNLQDIKDLLLMCWCQTPQHTFRDLLGSMDLVVRAVFV